MKITRWAWLLVAMLCPLSVSAQDRVLVSVKHVLGGFLNTRSVGLFTFEFEIREAFREMNDLLEREKLPWILELEEIEDVEDAEEFFEIDDFEEVETFEDRARSDPTKFKWRDDAINVYLVKSIEGAGGVCSFPHDRRHDEIVVIANGLFNGIANAAGGWLHEFGHYFSLLHTFEGGDSTDDCIGAGARHFAPPAGCPEGMEARDIYCYDACPDSCPDDDNIMSYNDLGVFFNIPGDFTPCQNRNMNYELYSDEGSRGHVLLACETACAGERAICLHDCNGDVALCRGVCDGVYGACTVPCDLTAGTCRVGCFTALGACDVGCDVFCFFAPNSDACKDCRSACTSARRSCESACDATEQGCERLCGGARNLCRDACDRRDCDSVCNSAESVCREDCPMAPIGPPGVTLPANFRRGDANSDRTTNISDGSFILDYLFAGGRAPPCLDSADINDNGELDLSDAIRLFGFLFLGSTPPPPPGTRDCGSDPTRDDPLGCAAPPVC